MVKETLTNRGGQRNEGLEQLWHTRSNQQGRTRVLRGGVSSGGPFLQYYAYCQTALSYPPDEANVLTVCRVRVPPKPPPGSLCRPENLKALGRDILGISAALVVLRGQFTAVPSPPLSLSLSLSPFSTHPYRTPLSTQPRAIPILAFPILAFPIVAYRVWSVVSTGMPPDGVACTHTRPSAFLGVARRSGLISRPLSP